MWNEKYWNNFQLHTFPINSINEPNRKSNQTEIEIETPYRKDERQQIDVQDLHVGPANRSPARRQKKQKRRRRNEF